MVSIKVPKPITDFGKKNLNGWLKNRIVVSNHQDPTMCDFYFESFVLHNWPTQQHSRYKEGFIQFANRKKFDINRQTIDGIRRYLFFFNGGPYILGALYRASDAPVGNQSVVG